MNIELVERNKKGKVLCPVCNEAIMTEEGTEPILCDHVEFIYLQSVDEFENISDNIKKNEKKIKKIMRDGDWKDVVKAKLIPKNITILDFTESGMACGPVSFTTYIGIKK